MSILGKFLPGLVTNLHRSVCNTILARTNFHSLTQPMICNTTPGGVYDISIRNVIRCHFPRPSERKRIKRHGYWKRMSTAAGRRIIMRRILKGRHVLTH